MSFSFDSYDEHGMIKPPIWLWAGWLLLSRAWAVFIMAGASRDKGADLLALFYPSNDVFYVGLGLGFPVVLLMWLQGMKNKRYRCVHQFWRFGKFITLAILMIDIAMVINNLLLNHGRFHWATAVTLLLQAWFLLFIFRSKRVRATFEESKLG
ncbi:MAG: DUF2919 domain-containing protein [Aliivibrio sp.]|uniref:DUF2919 domain-containing protein n=1 Tax=Aliivibrio sp. TaxID=1872443 RepID=UPI001A49FBFF|nr:DUF2919 domain-containing protein [Aliivibrio sp.]